MKRYSALLSATIFMAFSATVLADCDGRPTTEKEAEYFKQTFAALRGALPVAPAGWTLAVREGMSNNLSAAPGEILMCV